MATTSMLKAKGLATFGNFLSEVPEGALLEAKNTVIQRDGIIEPRRGIKVLGETYDIPKQLLTFKNNILVHSSDVIQYSNGQDPAIFTTFKGKKDFSPISVDTLTDTITLNLHQLSNSDVVVFSTTGTLPSPLVAGTAYYVKNATQNTFQISASPDGIVIDLTTQGTGILTVNYDYVFKELELGLRVKSIELNSNLYVTTANGIKKITQNSEYSVTDAGTPKALGISLQLDLSTTIGFLDTDREVSYRVLWGTKDINDNLLLGVPSYRQVIQNFTGESRNVKITFTVPEGITTDYFYQVYRTNTAVVDGSGDEMRLVYEAAYTGGTTITVLDEQPEDIRDNGTPLYSNEFSGEGAFQTNNPPPIAKDVSIYRSTAFYANTINVHQNSFTLVGLDALGINSPIDSITGAFPATVQTTYIHNLNNGDHVLLDKAGAISGRYTISNVTSNTFEISADSADFNPAATDFPVVYSAYFKTEKNGVINEYFFVGAKEIYNVEYKSKDQIASSSYFLLNSHDALIKYCVWYDLTGIDVEPILSVAEGQDRVFLRIDLSDLGTKTFAPAQVNISTDEINIINHGYVNDQKITFTSTGTLPAPLTEATTYYIVNSTADKFQVSLTLGGVAIDLTSQGTGEHKTSVAESVTSVDIAKVTSEALISTGDFEATAIGGPSDTIATANSGSAQAIGYPSGQNGSVGFEGVTSISLLYSGSGEDASKLFVRKSELTSPAAAIQDTAQSLEKVINLNTNEGVYAYYTATATDLPGTISLESKTKDTVPFNVSVIQVYADNTNIPFNAAMFNPDLRTTQTSISESFPNKVFFSKVQQPEAVPLVNSITIGPKDKAILRIIGLRDSLFILKEEGIYRLTGDNPSNFSVSLFDNSATITAPDTACVLNNQIYALTTQGVVTISETGVGVISRPIEDKFLKITAPAFVNYKTQCFAVSYESDRSYTIFVPRTPSDSSATWAYVYNTFTQAWTEWDKSGTCGIVETNVNRLYVGAADIPACEVERKDLTSRDYADRQYQRNINVYDSGFIYLDNTSNVVVGDMLTQTQYVTQSQFNSLIEKLKLDPFLPNFEFNLAKAGDDLEIKLEQLCAELNNNDVSRNNRTFNPSVDVDALSDTFNINSHGFVDGDLIWFDPVPVGLSNFNYYVVNSSANSFQISLSKNGTPVPLDPQVLTLSYVSNEYKVFSSGFEDLQIEYNEIVEKLNTSSGVFFTDYKPSEDSIYHDLLVTIVQQNQNRVQVMNISPFWLGPVTHYKAIKSSIVWNYNDLGDPSLSKHVREGVTLIESTSLANVYVGYATDLSGDFEEIYFPLSGDGGWGDSVYNNVAWGGSGISVPMRTYIPRQKSRCRYIKARLRHENAFYKYNIMGIAYTFEVNSERAWRR